MSPLIEALVKTLGVFLAVAGAIAVVWFTPPVLFWGTILVIIVLAVLVTVFAEFYEGAQRRNENRKEWNQYLAEEKARNKEFENRINAARRELKRLEDECPAPKE